MRGGEFPPTHICIEHPSRTRSFPVVPKMALRMRTPNVEVGSKHFALDFSRCEKLYFGRFHFNTSSLEGLYFASLRDLLRTCQQHQVKDLCVAVPPWFNAAQKKAIKGTAADFRINSSLIATNEAAAITYAYFNRKKAEERNVMFVVIGETGSSASVANVCGRYPVVFVY